MGVLGAAVVGFVAGIALVILIDEALGLGGGFWDVVAVLVGLAGAVIAVRLVRLRSHPRDPRQRHHHRHA